MEEEIRKRIENGTFTDDDIVSLMCWQLSLPGEEMDCALIDECDRYLSRDAAGLSDADRDRMWRQMLVRIGGAETHRRAVKPARPRRISRRRAAVLLLLALLALAVGGVAYTVRRGVLNFTEDFGFAPMVSQDGAERLVTSGSLAHIELEQTIIDVREAVYDGSVLQAVVAVQGKENRRAVMLGDDGNVSADAVLVDVGEDGEIETAREEDGVLLVYIRQEMRTAENELHVVWPCFASVADADGLSWSSPQVGTLVFDVPRTAPQTLDMQMRVELEHALTLTHIAVETTPLGATLTISYQPGERLKAAMPEFDVEDGARVVNRRGTLSREGDAQTGYTVCIHTDPIDSLPHTLTLGVRGLSSKVRVDFDAQTATMIKGEEAQ